jgi:hypothetical protein
VKILGTLIRFIVGGIIGFYAVALVSSNAYLAVIMSVACGVLFDKIWTRKSEIE